MNYGFSGEPLRRGRHVRRPRRVRCGFYTVRDTRHAGLGVRVRPSGHRSFVYCRKGKDGARRITLSSATLTSVEEARTKCRAIEAGAQLDPTEHDAVPTFREFVWGPGRVCIDRCKPSTQRSVRWVLNARLLPTFGSLPLDQITPARVTRWFDKYSRTAPGGANHALKRLRRILNHAVECGHLQTNSAGSVKRNPRPKLTRFLSREEIRRPARGARPWTTGTSYRRALGTFLRRRAGSYSRRRKQVILGQKARTAL